VRRNRASLATGVYQGAVRARDRRLVAAERATAPRDSSEDAADRERRQHNRTTAWGWRSVIVGLLVIFGSIVISLVNGRLGPLVLNDAELVPVLGLVLTIVGLLVVLQELVGDLIS
jgi:predicted anti-sigma-YlaC factor YlaD